MEATKVTTMTDALTFTIDDVELLYTIPKQGGDLAKILRTFVFINRASPPIYAILHGCFSKAMKTGILLTKNEQYHIEEKWYQRIHAHDNSRGNEIDSMLDFQDEFVGEEVPALGNEVFSVSEDEYTKIVQEIRG